MEDNCMIKYTGMLYFLAFRFSEIKIIFVIIIFELRLDN